MLIIFFLWRRSKCHKFHLLFTYLVIKFINRYIYNNLDKQFTVTPQPLKYSPNKMHLNSQCITKLLLLQWINWYLNYDFSLSFYLPEFKTQSEVLNIILVIKVIAIGHTSTILVCQIDICYSFNAQDHKNSQNLKIMIMIEIIKIWERCRFYH